MTAMMDLPTVENTTPMNMLHPTEVNILQNGSIRNVSVQGIPEIYKDAQIGFLVILLVFIVTGNVTVLAAIALSKERRRSRMNFFIMHLALCDLLNGPLIVLSDLVTKITIYWYGGETFCKLHKFAQILVMYASTYMLVALSIDRLDAVARPLHFTGSWFRAKILIVTAWALSFLFAVPELILFQVKERHGGPMCIISLSTLTWQVYICLIAASVFFIPAFIILVCYLAIIVVIFNSSHLINSVSKHSLDAEGESSSDLISRRKRSAQCQSSRGVIPQAKIRTIKMTFLIVFVFILSWSPYFVFNICHVFKVLPHSEKIFQIATFIQSLAPLNSAMNPIIYGIFSTRVCLYIRHASLASYVPTWVRPCCLHSDHPPKRSTADYTSVTETEDFRLTGEIRSGIAQNCSSRVPLVKQQLTQADRELLSLHVRTHVTSDNV